MCLYIDQKVHKNLEPRIAKKELYTLKFAKESNNECSLSYFQKEKQYFGKLLNSEIVKVQDNIYAGLHSLMITNKIDLNTFKSQIFWHRFDDSIFNTKEIILCKIPKGSQYYIGIDNDIVSNQLVLIEPLVCSKTSKIKLEEKTKYLYGSNEAYIKAVEIFLSYYNLPKYY